MNATKSINNNVDKLITALYLAQSDNREMMLSDLIKNVLSALVGVPPAMPLLVL